VFKQLRPTDRVFKTTIIDYFSGIIDPAETVFDDFRRDYLGKYEALAGESGGWG
jgi:hypothetical protein